jgi:transcriptional regulator with XRE-family HTH domain
MLTLGGRVKAYRHEREWTQKYLSDISKVHQPLISQLESGMKQWTSVEVVDRLAKAFGVSIEELLHGKTDEGMRAAGMDLVPAASHAGSENPLARA